MEENEKKHNGKNNYYRHRNKNKHKHFDKNKQNKDENIQEAEAEEAEVTDNSESPEISEQTVEGKPAEVIEGGVEIVGINFRRAGKIYFFAPGDIVCKLGAKVIVETSRGIEMGVVKIPNKIVAPKMIVSPLRKITRLATEDDIDRAKANKDLEQSAKIICKKKIAEHNLDMHLVDVEYTFDNSKLIFHFSSEGRVDFRELVKDLASVFHTRIELHQIGIRDEAKMMGGLGSCGNPFCCAEFMSDFAQVSIKMAKEQNFSLNSAKISGSCGRLMCCLRFEHEAYESALLTTPPTGSIVETAQGQGVVIETRPLLQLVKVKFADEKYDCVKIFPCEEVKVKGHIKHKKADDEKENEEEELPDEL